jgi:hypothetical protein
MLKDGYEKVICPLLMPLPHINLMTHFPLDETGFVQNRGSSEMDRVGCWT